MYSRVLHVINVTPMAMNSIRNIILLYLLFLTGAQTSAQSIKGEVSYVTDSHVYLKWSPTQGLEVSDSLKLDETYFPVIAKSSVSLVLERRNHPFEVGELISFEWTVLPEKTAAAATSVEDLLNEVNPVQVVEDEDLDNETSKYSNSTMLRLSSTALSNFASNSAYMIRTSERGYLSSSWSKGTTQHILDFRGTLRQYQYSKGTDMRTNLYQASYLFKTKGYEAQLGRFMPRFAGALGAVDGGRISWKGPAQFHAIAGFRPNYFDHSLQLDQPLIGGFLSTPRGLGKGHWNATAGWVTYYAPDSVGVRGVDRSVLYQQLSGQLSDKVSVYAALEWDAFQQLEGKSATWNIQPLATYISVQYAVKKGQRLFFSYDNRAPRIFYRQFDMELEQLLFDLGTQQGFRTRYSARLNPKINLGISATYRKQSTSAEPFILYNAYLRTNKFILPGHIYASWTHSRNSSFSTQIAQVNYQNKWGDLGSWKIYSRYLHYQYPGSTFIRSDRIYFGGQLTFQWNALSANLRSEISYRDEVLYPTIITGITYRFKSKQK